MPKNPKTKQKILPTTALHLNEVRNLFYKGHVADSGMKLTHNTTKNQGTGYKGSMKNNKTTVRTRKAKMSQKQTFSQRTIYHRVYSRLNSVWSTEFFNMSVAANMKDFFPMSVPQHVRDESCDLQLWLEDELHEISLQRCDRSLSRMAL